MPTGDAASGKRYSRNPEVLSTSLGPEEAALLRGSRDNYYGLNGPATGDLVGLAEQTCKRETKPLSLHPPHQS